VKLCIETRHESTLTFYAKLVTSNSAMAICKDVCARR